MTAKAEKINANGPTDAFIQKMMHLVNRRSAQNAINSAIRARTLFGIMGNTLLPAICDQIRAF